MYIRCVTYMFGATVYGDYFSNVSSEMEYVKMNWYAHNVPMSSAFLWWSSESANNIQIYVTIKSRYWVWSQNLFIFLLNANNEISLFLRIISSTYRMNKDCALRVSYDDSCDRQVLFTFDHKFRKVLV